MTSGTLRRNKNNTVSRKHALCHSFQSTVLRLALCFVLLLWGNEFWAAVQMYSPNSDTVGSVYSLNHPYIRAFWKLKKLKNDSSQTKSCSLLFINAYDAQKYDYCTLTEDGTILILAPTGNYAHVKHTKPKTHTLPIVRTKHTNTVVNHALVVSDGGQKERRELAVRRAVDDLVVDLLLHVVLVVVVPHDARRWPEHEDRGHLWWRRCAWSRGGSRR